MAKHGKVDVIDPSGTRRSVLPVDAREIVASGGSYAKSRKPKNYHFRDKEGEPFYYRAEYLRQIDIIAPEVSRDLFSLLPLRDSVFGAGLFPRGTFDNWFFTKDDSIKSLYNPDGTFRSNELLVYLTGRARYSRTPASEYSPEDSDLIRQAIELRTRYLALIENYSLDTEWLRSDLFRLLNRCSSLRAKELPLSIAHSFGFNVQQGERFRFEFDGWRIDRDSSSYKEIVLRIFSDQLNEYTERTAAAFRERGYRTFGRPPEYENVKWLAFWNLKRLTKAGILAAISKERPSSMTEDQLNERFREFETKYDLPYRRAKRGKRLP